MTPNSKTIELNIRYENIESPMRFDRYLGFQEVIGLCKDRFLELPEVKIASCTNLYGNETVMFTIGPKYLKSPIWKKTKSLNGSVTYFV